MIRGKAYHLSDVVEAVVWQPVKQVFIDDVTAVRSMGMNS